MNLFLYQRTVLSILSINTGSFPVLTCLICHSPDRTCCHCSWAPHQTRVTNCNYVVFRWDNDKRPDCQFRVRPKRSFINWHGKPDNMYNKCSADCKCNGSRNSNNTSIIISLLQSRLSAEDLLQTNPPKSVMKVHWTVELLVGRVLTQTSC